VAEPLGGYRGLENQLYRVEIHDPGPPVTFKWSRDNGSAVAAWSGLEGNDLIVDGIHDRVHGFSPEQWVELTDEISQLRNRPGVMVRLVKVERNRLTFDPSSTPAGIPVPTGLRHPVVRRWDQIESKNYSMPGGAIVLQKDKTYPLEHGVQIAFAPEQDKPVVAYRSGDYWLIPARTAVGDIEWPFHLDTTTKNKIYEFADPQGIHHVYAPLAKVTFKVGSDPQIVPFQRKISQLWIQ
jgi:hypothetical protein